MSVIDFIGQIINRSARVGFAVALAAGTLYLAREYGFGPARLVPDAAYGTVLAGGLVGGWIAVVEIGLRTVGWLKSWITKRAANADELLRKEQFRQSNFNLLLARSLDRRQIVAIGTLLFLKREDMNRFSVIGSPPVIDELKAAGLIERDQGPRLRSGLHEPAFYIVPDTIWTRLGELEDRYPNVRIGHEAPWLSDHNGWARV